MEVHARYGKSVEDHARSCSQQISKQRDSSRRQPFCPIDLEGGHEFHVLTRTVAGPDITSDILSILKNGKQCSSYIMENVCLICLLGFG